MSEVKDALINFEMDGGSYGFIMPATSLDDAERRMRAIRLTGKVVGWPAYTHRANLLTLPFVAAWTYAATFVRNVLRVHP